MTHLTVQYYSSLVLCVHEAQQQGVHTKLINYTLKFYEETAYDFTR